MRFDHVLQTIGRTPAVRLARLAPSHVELYAKLESFNPMGSVKDRMALAALHARTGQATIPQAFVGGQWIGGCTDTLSAWQDGRLPAQLKALAVPFDAGAVRDPHTLLTSWLQTRRAA